MPNDIVPFDQFHAPSTVFAQSTVDPAKFMGGIQASFAILTIKGKEWGIRYHGETKQLTAPNPAAGGALFPVQWLDVVVVDAAPTISKVWYEKGFVDGERTPPDCWSATGITPDPASPKKQSATCRGCPHNVFGSKIDEAGQRRGKECPDNKRLAIVPLSDIKNELYGGPVMLRLPPGSFAPYAEFVAKMASRHYPPFAVACRLTFMPNEAFPKVVFTPLRPLNDQEALQVLEVQKSPQLERMLSDPAIGAFADAEADEVVQAVAPPPTATQAPPPPPVQAPPVQAPPVQAPVVQAAPTGTTGFGVAVAPGGAPAPVQQAAPAPGASWAATPAAPIQAPAAAPQPDLTIPPHLRRTEVAASPPLPAPVGGEVLTPEQMKIRELEAALAAATGPKPGRKPRAKPVGPAVAANPAVNPAQQVTQPGNGAAQPAETPAAASVGNAIADRIAALAGAKT